MRYLEFPVLGRVDLTSVVPPDGYLWSRGGRGFAAWGTALRIDVGTGPERFRRAQAEIDTFFGRVDQDPDAFGPVAVGSFTFDGSSAGSILVVPEVFVHRRDGTARIGVLGDAELPSLGPGVATSPVKVRYAGSSLPEVDWLDAVSRAIKALRAQELEKVVLARDLLIWGERPFELPGLLRNLAERFPDCYAFACGGLVGATPELLIGRDGERLSSLVLAGTTARGSDDVSDDALGRELLDSAKDRAEHLPALRSVIDVLEPLCRELDVEATPHLLRLANVQHLATTVAGRTSTELSALELAGLLHPTAAVCGSPTDDAMRMIGDLEGMDRGRYAGPVGWVDRNGDGAWGIALRCAEIDGDRGRLFAGGGIVPASEPEAELEETRLKFRAMMSALEGT